MIGTQELIIILAVILLLFGADRLPELAKSLGAATREFRKAQRGLEGELKKIEKEVEVMEKGEER
ncbi:MAG: twin-arginine translocase TatA/TatE family subunit [Candidatus Methanofastidiosia archaeon]